jgi:NDP-sugar pyrophosphorylase family protein
MAPVSDRPFLEHLLQDLRKNGYSRVILSLGYGADAVLSYLRSAGWGEPFVRWVREPEPLGTGGGLLHALQTAKLSGPAIVANADTWIEGAWAQLAREAPNAAAIGVVPVSHVGRYGEVRLDEAQTRVLRFLEKTGEPRAGLIYSGIAVLSRGDLEPQPSPAFSLEKDVLPKLVAQKRLHAFHFRGRFTDIGTPEDYHAFCRAFGK